MKAVEASMSERQLQTAVVDIAHLFGWRVAHFATARTADGRFLTPVAADAKGWPDLVMVRGDRIVAFELKSARGVVSKEQGDWLVALGEAGVDVDVIRPADYRSGHVEKTLR